MEHMPVCFGQAAARPPRLAKTRRFNSVEEYLQVGGSGRVPRSPDVQSAVRQEWERTQNVALEMPHFGTLNSQLQAAPPKPRPAPLVVDTNLVSVLSIQSASVVSWDSVAAGGGTSCVSRDIPQRVSLPDFG